MLNDSDAADFWLLVDKYGLGGPKNPSTAKAAIDKGNKAELRKFHDKLKKKGAKLSPEDQKVFDTLKQQYLGYWENIEYFIKIQKLMDEKSK